MATGSSMDDLTYVGVMGIIDPERPQVEKAVGQLQTGGVIVKMITGDAEKTAKAIGELAVTRERICERMESLVLVAIRLNIYKANDLSISGEDLDHMSPADLHHAVSQATIFYRVSPKHKLTIVKVGLALQGKRERTFGMTG